MIKHLLAVGMLVFLTSCSWGYGSLQDYSKFVIAKLLDDKKSILFTYHRYTYPPLGDMTNETYTHISLDKYTLS